MDVFSDRNSNQLLISHQYTTWGLIKLYWQSEYKKSAYLFSFFIIFLSMLLVALDVVFNYWFNYFYDALQKYQASLTVKLLFIFFILAGINIVIAVYRYYFSQVFAIRWRRWLTKQTINRWLEKRGYYHLETFFDSKTDNPDQRIQDDINGLVTSSITLTVGLFTAIATLFAFVYILWTLSGVITLNLGGLGIWHIYGYLVWIGLIYNLMGTLITFKIGRPLINLNFEQQRREATFRFSAIDLRSHAEQIALYKGEEHQKGILKFHFFRVLENWYAIVLRQKLLLWFTTGFNQTAILLPLIVALPNYFNKVFLLGGFIQTIRAFGSVQESLAFLVNAYTQIAEWKAISQRLITFVNHLNDVNAYAKKINKIDYKEQVDNAIIVKNLQIETPHKNVLLKDIDQQFLSGQDYLIKGESGIGKSTFIRTLAGIWPYAKGEIIFPKQKTIMYLPQKPYMPIGTLAEAVLFPDKKNVELEKNLERVLHDCHLAEFIPRLMENARWSEQLSPGEQQRFGFARVLLHKPDWVFLDESTSMLDLNNEAHLYSILKKRLPTCSIVSVGHRSSVNVFHQHIVDMEQYVMV